MAKAEPMMESDGVTLRGYLIFCPGCGHGHLFDSRWTFNGDVEKPTFRASMLVNPEGLKKGSKQPRCHSFVTDGKIQFLSDCEHELAGQTVDLPDFEEDL